MLYNSRGDSMFEGVLFKHFDDFDLTEDRRSNLQNHVSDIKINLTDAIVDNPCVIEGTVGQSNSEVWHHERLFRVTASKCKTACNFGEQICQGNGYQIIDRINKFVIENFWSPRNIKTVDMKYGIEEEPKARIVYTQSSGHRILETGMWINKDYPHLGASPDGLILNDLGDPIGVLEIKCLKIFKDKSILEVVENYEGMKASKFLSGQCFEKKNGKLILKKSHMYYYQIQMQMLVTSLSFCDFVLYSRKGPPSVERIYEDRPFQNTLAQNSLLFWERVLIPEYFEMRLPRRLSLFIL